VYGSVLGFLGGISWALLMAKCATGTTMEPGLLIQNMFNSWCAWPWPSPVELSTQALTPKRGKFAMLDAEIWGKTPAGGRSGLMPILTPVYPSMNTAHGVSASTFRALTDELLRAAQITREQMGPEKCMPTDFRTSSGNGNARPGAKEQNKSLAWWRELSRPIFPEFAGSYTHYLEVGCAVTMTAIATAAAGGRTNVDEASQQQWEELFL
jgi:poly(A) polymerase